MSDNVISLDARRSLLRARVTGPAIGAGIGYRHQGRNARNPLRQHLQRLSIAVVEVNKVDHQHPADQLRHISEGAAAARILADVLEATAKRLESR